MSDLFFRTVPMERKLNEETRQIEVSFSSEYPVERYFGNEILLHGPGNVDLSYLDAVGSALQRHGGGVSDIVGPIIRSWIDNRRGYAIVGFDDDEIGNRALAKLKSGSLRGVSFGYLIEKGIRLDESGDTWIDPETKIEYRGPAVIGTYWRAHEITFTPVPADHTVGPNRSLVDQICFENLIRKMEDSRMDEKDKNEIMEMVRSSLASVKTDILGEVQSLLKEEKEPKIQFDRAILVDLTNRGAAVSDTCKARVFELAFEGKTQVEILNFINDEAMRSKGNSGDSQYRQPAGNGNDNLDDKKYRTIDEIPDDMFVDAFGGGR